MPKTTKLNGPGDSLPPTGQIPVQSFQPSPSSIMIKYHMPENVVMNIELGSCQHQGARDYQEDAFGFSNISDEAFAASGLLAVLADGMGGLANGDEVANLVVQSARNMAPGIVPPKEMDKQLEAILKNVNNAVCDKFLKNGRTTAGSTAVLAYIYRTSLYWATTGDSRLYMLRGNELTQLNEDHDYKNELFRRYLVGDFRFEDIERDPQKDSLVNYIGKDGLYCFDSSKTGIEICPGDYFILCSDGVYNSITADSMREILVSCDPQTACERIVANIVSAGFRGQDNMTIIVIKCSAANS